jgi:hypothetical protein
MLHSRVAYAVEEAAELRGAPMPLRNAAAEQRPV